MVQYRKKEEGMQIKPTWMGGIHGITGEIGIIEEDWRKRTLTAEDNWTNLNKCKKMRKH